MIEPAPLRTEVVIVGGGPAGAATALHLARAGVDVLIVERARFPRPKPCGECLSPGATRLLVTLGVLDDVLALAPARLHGWRIFAPDGGRMEARFDAIAGGQPHRAALAIDRARFDAVLLRAALAAGARLLEPCRVTGVLTTGDAVTGVTAVSQGAGAFSIHGRLVIGADGLRSIVARSLRMPARAPRLRKLSLTVHLPGIAGLDGFGELHLAAGACAGVAPVSAHAAGACNVSVVVAASAADRDARGAHARLDAALARFPRLESRFRAAAGTAADGIDVRTSGPFDVPMRRVAGAGFALVGDAAGYYDPFTGQGICHALRDAARLANAVLSARRGGAVTARSLAGYDRATRARRAEAHALQRAIEHIVRSPALADRFIPAIQRSPRTRNALLAATGDLTPPRALLSPTLLLTFLADSLGGRA